MAFGQFSPRLLCNPVHLAALRADLAERLFGEGYSSSCKSRIAGVAKATPPSTVKVEPIT